MGCNRMYILIGGECYAGTLTHSWFLRGGIKEAASENKSV